MDEATRMPAPAAPRLATLSGKTVALLDISKPGGDIFLDRLERLLVDRYGVKRVLREKKPTFARPAPPAVLDRLREARPDALIEALAD
jgi:hypothetical protein